MNFEGRSSEFCISIPVYRQLAGETAFKRTRPIEGTRNYDLYAFMYILVIDLQKQFYINSPHTPSEKPPPFHSAFNRWSSGIAMRRCLAVCRCGWDANFWSVLCTSRGAKFFSMSVNRRHIQGIHVRKLIPKSDSKSQNQQNAPFESTPLWFAAIFVSGIIGLCGEIWLF